MTGRVLVVDDILANLKLLEARLSAEYFDVLTARSGQEALELLEVERIDVVLLDVMMPGLDGPATLACLQQAPTTSATPVVFVTAKATRDELRRLTALGARGVICKPFDSSTLLGRVEALLAATCSSDVTPSPH